MFPRLLRKLFWVLAFLMLLSWIVSGWLRQRWGRDVAEINVRSERFAFEARRDTLTGVWNLQAEGEENFYFAMGYVQALDREFQTELLRRAALGRLSENFGERVLKKDRLARLLLQASRAEWKALPADSPMRRASEAYVQGRATFLREAQGKPGHPLPIEYRAFGWERAQQEAWQAWELVAILRYQLWGFSFDLERTLQAEAFKTALRDNPALAKLLQPQNFGSALYEQPLVRGRVRPAPRSSAQGNAPPPLYWPTGETQARTLSSGEESLAWLDASHLDASATRAPEGASNAWVVLDPKVGLAPTLCNDTHLSFNWPGNFYPVRYALTLGPRKVEGQGYSLPGLPLLALGKVDVHGKQTDSIAWGVTLASFADTQDVREVPAKIREQRYSESFLIADPEGGKARTETIEETWTELGPRVESILEWPSELNERPLALDWIGLRQAASPWEFFLRRTLQGPEGLLGDLLEKWAYPATNFVWLQRSGEQPVQMGHMLTGNIYRQGSKTRTLSLPSQRPFLLNSADKENTYWAFASANQAVFGGKLDQDLASTWADSARSLRILEGLQEGHVQAESEQSDYVSPTLLDFLRRARRELTADRLCNQGGSNDEAEACLAALAELDKWKGEARAESWEALLLSLWYMNSKNALWPAAEGEKGKLRREWLQSTESLVALKRVSQDAASRAAWERATQLNFSEMQRTAFAQAWQLLWRSYGPDFRKWKWGAAHRVVWRHPFALFPEPFGRILMESFLGPPPAMNGALDSPGRSDFSWNPEAPLLFPAQHGAVTRFCATLGPEQPGARMRWTSPTGVSGNPFSPWAWAFARNYFFADKLAD